MLINPCSLNLIITSKVLEMTSFSVPCGLECHKAPVKGFLFFSPRPSSHYMAPLTTVLDHVVRAHLPPFQGDLRTALVVL